ncbi:T9SS type A sorting domain-containing protein [Psychroserpens sp. XS_ASV72]|uniref:T9SS type A sorting domain-containing protein n=1 Tax=Psychroserpens sp. XS_ASV72 TaxID=3241293 RepID=UPI0035139727
MKTKLLSILFSIVSSFAFAQNIAAGQTSDFSSGVQGWIHQISNANDPVQVPTGGPAGAGDAFLRVTNSVMTGSAGSKHLCINMDAEWTGNYTAAGIVAITCDVQNPGTETLHLRVALNKSFPNWAASANPIVVPPGTTWTSITFPLNSSDLVISQGGATIADILADVDQIRIVSNDGTSPTDPIHKGQGGVARISELDNITAVDVLGVSQFETSKEFSISPNPATSKLNVYLPSNTENAVISVFDVLGKRVYKREIDALTSSSIDVSNWNSGVYLVRISTDHNTQTKRFVKQ